MDIPGYSSHVLVNGRKVKEYRHNGLTFIEAKDGTEFSIEVKNHYPYRVLAIVSVDGLDVIDGKPATNKSRGYIINGHDSVTINGWRKSDAEVGAFKFVTSDKSYATEKGSGQNNGVIAVKFIAEKPKAYVPKINWPQPQPQQPWDSQPWLPDPKWPSRPTPYYRLDQTGNAGLLGGGTLRGMSAGRTLTADYSTKSAPTASAYACSVDSNVTLENASFDMGTTWGSVRQDKVTETEFEYGNEIDTHTFYYASREALKAMGIPLISERQVVRLPEAFQGGYAQPPKNWRP
jgi:hypothetical protein